MKLRAGIIGTLFFLPFALYGQPGRVDSLLHELDRTIGQREIYIGQKLATIDSIETLTRAPGLSDRALYELNSALITRYESFRYDSTMLYLRRNGELAERIGEQALQDDARIRLSFALTDGGLYMRAIDELNALDPARLSAAARLNYYKSFERVYHHLSLYAGESYYAADYAARAGRYLDSMASMTPADSGEAMGIAARRLIAAKEYAAAKELLRKYLATVPFPSHDYAIISATLARVYQAAPEGDNREICLILSAISDLRMAVRENESLLDLAELRMDRGDVDRAWRYSQLSMEDANFYNSRLRRIEVAKTLPLIERAYQMRIDEQHRRLRRNAVWLGVLSAVLLFGLAVVLRQMYALRRARLRIGQANAELSKLNGALVESTRIKEEYIGYFMRLSSDYIDKMERYQSSALNRLNAGKMDELKALVRSSLIDHEIKEFYLNFDRIFLKIFPDFVSGFNRLLRPEEQIVVPRDELLTTELRIFALVRLGICDSSRIAKFLRYSANTVYTYRTKVKNKAIDRARFEQDLMKINLY
jgi:hypothetical protein